MTIKWLDRSIWTLPFHLVLCTSAKRYAELMDWMQVPAANRETFPTAAVPGKRGGWVTMYEKDSELDICLVCVVPTPDDPAAALSTIVHEAVHVWQNAKDIVSPNRDVGREPEAYAIQAIYDTLMEEYAKQVPTAAKPRAPSRASKRTRRKAG